MQDDMRLSVFAEKKDKSTSLKNALAAGPAYRHALKVICLWELWEL